MSEDVQIIAAGDENYRVRMSLGNLSNLSSSAWERLCLDRNALVVDAALRSHHADHTDLALHAHEPAHHLAILSNPNVTPDVIDAVTNTIVGRIPETGLDKHLETIDALLTHPETSPTAIRHLSSVIASPGSWAAIASHQNTPSSILAKAYERSNLMSAQDAEDVRLSVASNPKAGAWMLSQMVNDGASERLLSAIAAHPDTTGDMLRQIAIGPDMRFRETASAAAAVSHPNAGQQMVFRAVSDSSPVIRRAALRSPLVHADMMTVLVRDADPEVRRLVAEHPITPSCIVDTLSRDTNDQVRGAAQARLQ